MNLSDIEIRDITENSPGICADLCNELMQFQAEQSIFGKDVLAAMTFNNRLKQGFEKAKTKNLLVALDNEKPVGYVYADVADIPESSRYYIPEWAKDIYTQDHLMFFPPQQQLPARLGTFNNLYIKPEYHGLGLGHKLCRSVMDWMKSIEKISGIYVYVSNGNEKVADFYKKYGFRFSHDVLGGFITAWYQDIL
ncbi:MAG TPA: GNAT family N-acetyltransferase [Bacteroidales bacterium]|nr:GNAT family N-acetyltransferase [Bacteroidales bacterium]